MRARHMVRSFYTRHVSVWHLRDRATGRSAHSRRSHAPTVPQMAFVLGASFVLGIDDQAGQQGVQGIVLPPAAMDFKAQAPRVRAVQSFRQGEMQLEGWEPLMPTLFLPAAPKSATTWLYGCMDNTTTTSNISYSL